jgi:hypothetical protein
MSPLSAAQRPDTGTQTKPFTRHRSHSTAVMGRVFEVLLIAAFSLAPVFASDPAHAPVAQDGCDMLVYHDGDTVKGRVMEQDDHTIPFRSNRFGELRIAASDATVVLGRRPAAGAAGPVKAAAPPPEEKASPMRARVTPWTLAAALHDFFGPWKGRLAFSTELVSDTADREAVTIEGRLRRKWTADEVQLNARYDFYRTAGVSTTDVIAIDGSWRHDFGRPYFSLYRAAIELNRDAFTQKVASDYLLVQQEVGAGVTAVDRTDHKLRVGLSQSLFDIWNTAAMAATHSSKVVQSVFVEAE